MCFKSVILVSHSPVRKSALSPFIFMQVTHAYYYTLRTRHLSQRCCTLPEKCQTSKHPKHPDIQSIPNIQLSKESRITKQRQPVYPADGGAPRASLGRHQSAGAGSPAGTWRTLPTIAHRHMQRMIVSTASARASSPWRRCVSLVCRERPRATVAAPPSHSTPRTAIDPQWRAEQRAVTREGLMCEPCPRTEQTRPQQGSTPFRMT